MSHVCGVRYPYQNIIAVREKSNYSRSCISLSPLRQLPESIYLRLPVRPAIRIEEIMKPLHGRRSARLRAPVVDRLGLAGHQAPVDTAYMVPFENRQVRLYAAMFRFSTGTCGAGHPLRADQRAAVGL